VIARHSCKLLIGASPQIELCQGGELAAGFKLVSASTPKVAAPVPIRPL
jgi:hypothetical protein